MSKDDYIRLPRLYVDHELSENTEVSFSGDQAHYLRNVMRRQPGDRLRLFNGRDGEWRAALTTLDKKGAMALPDQRLLPQPPRLRETHLLFAPLKKARMDLLVEKAVELGATHLHPVLTQNTEVREIKEDRLRAQIIEAAEQCERLDIPVLSALKKLPDLPVWWDKIVPLYACLERQETKLLQDCPVADKAAFLIGPEGGFSEEEAALLQKIPLITPVSLGPAVYRAETAAIICLCSQIFQK